jgi:hypothetical protein
MLYVAVPGAHVRRYTVVSLSAASVSIAGSNNDTNNRKYRILFMYFFFVNLIDFDERKKNNKLREIRNRFLTE